MANVGIITGDCPAAPGDCQEPWCLDDGAPPGYELIPEFPVVPPNPINCEVTSNEYTQFFRYLLKLSNGMYAFNDNLNIKIYDSTMTTASASMPAYMSGCGETNGYAFVQKSRTEFSRLNLATNIVETIPMTGGTFSIGFSLSLSCWNGYVAIGGTSHQINGTYYKGVIVFNTDGVFVRFIGDLHTASNEMTGHVINGVVLLTSSSGAGSTIRMYDITTGDSLGDLPKPVETYTNRGYGDYIIDLGIVEGKGRFAVYSGDFVNVNNQGFLYNAYWKAKNKMTLYDYDFNMLVDVSSPISGETSNTWFGAAVTRYGHYLIVAEANAGTVQGTSNAGAMHLYTDDGVFVKTLSNWDPAAVPADTYSGGGIAYEHDYIMSYGVYSKTTRRCTY